MRVTSDFWVSALLRRINGSSGFGAVVRRGASEAGAIFIVVAMRSGRALLYGPAPQSLYDSGKPEERLFDLITEAESAAGFDERLAREVRFDPDVWIVEIEPAGELAEDMIPVRTR